MLDVGPLLGLGLLLAVDGPFGGEPGEDFRARHLALGLAQGKP